MNILCMFFGILGSISDIDIISKYWEKFINQARQYYRER